MRLKYLAFMLLASASSVQASNFDDAVSLRFGQHIGTNQFGIGYFKIPEPGKVSFAASYDRAVEHTDGEVKKRMEPKSLIKVKLIATPFS